MFIIKEFKFFFFLITLLLAGTENKCNQIYDIRYITNSNGLSNSSVNKIFQDSENLLWVGTWDGLNMYDGSNFVTFHPELNNPNCISNQVILDITEDKHGKLWINTNHGINRYDKKTKKFTHYYFSRKYISPTAEYEFQVARDYAGNIFCAAKDWGIGYFRNDSVHLLYTPGNEHGSVRKLLFSSSRSLIVLFDSGKLFELRLDYSDDEGISYAGNNFLSDAVLDFLVCSENEIMILNNEGQLFNYSSQTKSAGKVLYSGVNRIIGKTNNGIFIHSESENRMIDFSGAVHSSSWSEAVKNKKITAIFDGTQDVTWIGTDGEGLIKIYPQRKVFGLYSNSDIPFLVGGIVRAFHETPDGSLWVGTKGKGLLRIRNNSHLGPKQNLLYDSYHSGNSRLDNSVFALLYGQDRILYIGTENGLALFDLENNKLIFWDEITGVDKTKAFKSVYSIYQEINGTIWLGTSGFGLVRLKLERRSRKLILSDYNRYLAGDTKQNAISSNVIFSVIPENDSLLWLGTRLGGLNLFNKKTGKATSFFMDETNPQSISSNDILCLFKDSQKRLWIGTSLGLNLLIKHDFTGKATFKPYTIPDGLPNNTIHGIVNDMEGNLWISTNYGISKFNPSDQQFQNYSEFDGLQDNEFADGAFYRSVKNGIIFMGGINGFNYFSPSEIQLYTEIPPLSISEIREQQTNTAVYNSHIITQEFASPPKIILNYNQNFFNIKMAVLSFINPEKCQYAYKLTHFDRDWNYIQTRRDVSFTNVPPGKYELWLKWTNSDGVWSNPVHSIDIVVKPIFWQSGLARVMYLLIAILVILFVYNYLKKQSLLKRNQILLQREEEIHQTRLTFFTNIAHELQTPLTLIVGPIQKLVDSPEIEHENRMFTKMIQRNTNRLLFLIQQLLEFRRAEYLHLEIKTEKFNIVDLVEQVSELFDELAIQKQIEYRVESPREIVGFFDQDKVEKILFNLLSNAFKYTPEQGTIVLRIAPAEKEKIEITLSNTGKGISKEKLDRLFERFFITPENENAEPDKIRTGIGLAYSKSLVSALNGSIEVESIENETTTFRIVIPASRHKSEENKKEESVSNVILSSQLQNILVELNDNQAEISDKIRKIDALENQLQTILIVEDEPEIHLLLNELLSNKYRIVTAGNGIEALKLLRNEVPDLILSDVMMPRMDGIELCKIVKNDKDLCHIPIILLTAKSAVEHRIEGIESGANSYIPKPFHPKHLEVRIEKLLEEKERIFQYFLKDSKIEDISKLSIQNEDKQFIEKVIEIINQQISNPELQVAFLENEFGMSSARFYRKLKQISGLSPGDLIRSVRLKHAAGLLRNTSMNVMEIFYQSGFNNRSYFYREFQKMYHISPKQYQLKFSKILF